MYFVKVYVTYKESVLDPQGQTILGAIERLGYQGVQDVRMGKYFELQLDQNIADVEQEVQGICDRLLANPNMEQYTYDIQTRED